MNSPENAGETSLTPEELAYLQSLSEKERMAYHIAKSHLQSSFSLRKSNGFVKYMKTMKEKAALVAAADAVGGVEETKG